MTNKNQQGFAHVLLAVTLVVVVAGVGDSGYYVWHKNHEKSQATKMNSAQTQSNSSRQTTTSITTYDECLKAAGSIQLQTSPAVCKTKDGQSFTQGGAQKYLAIKEWGVTVPIPSTVNTSDIYYVLKTDSSTKSAEAILGSMKLGELVTNCSVRSSTGGTPFGWIERMTPTAYTSAKADATDTGVTSGTLFDGYYYVWQGPRANCSETTLDGNAKLQAQVKPLFDTSTGLVDNFPTDMPTILSHLTIAIQ